MATLGLSKVFILDKYFTELQKYWATERNLQETSSSNESANLHQRLHSLNTELVTLRSRLHSTPPALPAPLLPLHPPPPPPLPASGGSSGDTLCEPPSSGAAGAAARGTLAPPPLTGSAQALTNGVIQKANYTDSGSCRLSRLSADGSTVASGRTARGGRSGCSDLAHLHAPLTEHAVLETLHARFQDCRFFTNVGPILLAINAYSEPNNALTLTSVKPLPESEPLRTVVADAVLQQSETGYPQAIILSGASGSGKTYVSMLLLRHLLEIAGGGLETDTYKHLSAAFTVLRSLGTAKTHANTESSRVGHFIEAQSTDGALYRTKIHCYFLDHSRVVAPLANEKNFHIFYQILSGLSGEELGQLRLSGHTVATLNYLRHGDTRQNVKEEARRLKTWRQCLQVLGIPPGDVLRVLAACLLLGNIQFHDTTSAASASVCGEAVGGELADVADLLGVSVGSLKTGLTSKTHLVRGQRVLSPLDATAARVSADSLAKALYCRTVATIVRRANSLKPSGTATTASTATGPGAGPAAGGGGAPLSSSEDSHALAAAAGRGGAGSAVSGASGRATSGRQALSSALRRAAGFVGILDMFGFEEPQPSRLEHLCVNLCSETMQHFYNTHVFKSSLEICQEEGIRCPLQLEYTDNVPCIDLISSLRSGLLSILDAECAAGGTACSFVQRVRATHCSNSRLLEPPPSLLSSASSASTAAAAVATTAATTAAAGNSTLLFGVLHYAGKVTYSSEHFIERNRDVIADDIVCVFHKERCQFGFASHLFGAELRAFAALSPERQPRGINVRISPTAHSDTGSSGSQEPATTLTQDFHARLHNLLRTLVHARPHFVRCVSANDRQGELQFERTAVMRQIRALHVLETVQLMATGFPHRLRFRAFSVRYRCLYTGSCSCFSSLCHRQQQQQQQQQLLPPSSEANAGSCRQLLLNICGSCTGGCHTNGQQLQQQLQLPQPVGGWEGEGWALGERHVFLAERCRQWLERARHNRREQAASTLQRAWRRHLSPPGEASAVAPPVATSRHHIQQTCALFGLQLEQPPPLPPARSYTVAGNSRLAYPQARRMLADFPEREGGAWLFKGQSVTVIGASPSRRGHLLVQHGSRQLHVPHQLLQLPTSSPSL